MANYVEHAIYFNSKEECKNAFDLMINDNEIARAMNLYDSLYIKNNTMIIFAAAWGVKENLGALLVEKLPAEIEFEIHTAEGDGDSYFQTEDCSDIAEYNCYDFSSKDYKQNITNKNTLNKNRNYEVSIDLINFMRKDNTKKYRLLSMIFDGCEITDIDITELYTMGINAYCDNDGNCGLRIEGVVTGQQLIDFFFYFDDIADNKTLSFTETTKEINKRNPDYNIDFSSGKDLFVLAEKSEKEDNELSILLLELSAKTGFDAAVIKYGAYLRESKQFESAIECYRNAEKCGNTKAKKMLEELENSLERQCPVCSKKNAFKAKFCSCGLKLGENFWK